MGLDYRVNIFHTTIAYLQRILVEYFVESVAVRKVLLNEIEKSSANICFYVHGIWWMVQDYFAESVSSGSAISIMLVEFCIIKSPFLYTRFFLTIY